MKTIKKVLLVFPGLRVRDDEGSKHRLNSFINSYTDAGCRVIVLAFTKGTWKEKHSYLTDKCRWILIPQILPMAKSKIMSVLLFTFFRSLTAIITWIVRPNIVQMEGFAVNSRWCYPKSKYYTDFHGDLVYEVVESGQFKFEDWFPQFVIGIQKKSLQLSDKIICVTENLKKQLTLNTNTDVKDYAIISCGVDLDRFMVPPASLDVNLNNRIVLGYCGGLQSWQNIDIILNIVISLRKIEPRVFFMLFTNSDISSIQDKLTTIGKDNYIVKALKSSEVPSHLKLIDAGFLIRDNLILNRVASPTKISEYLAAGAGLICTEYSGDYERYVASSNEKVVYVLKNADDIVVNREYANSLLMWLSECKGCRHSNQFLAQHTFEAQFKNALLV